MSLKTDDGRNIVIAGKSRCGKTSKVVQLVKGFDTVFVWDIDDQWSKQPGYKRYTSLTALFDVIKTGRKGKYAYVSQHPDMKADFDKFCKLVFYYGLHFGKCAFVPEELSDVSSAGKASTSWGIVVRRGLKRGISIFPISQRWAEADKTAIRNASEYYCFQQEGDDCIYMAKATGIPLERLQALNKFEFLHKDTDTGKITSGKLPFKP